MKARHIRGLLLSALLLTSMPSLAGTLNCGFVGSAPYCAYTGRVSQVYVNAYDQILLYFDTDFGTAKPVQVGLPATTGGAAMVSMTAKPDFAKSFYATILAAQAQGKTITVQMYVVTNGYLQIDRVWLYE